MKIFFIFFMQHWGYCYRIIQFKEEVSNNESFVAIAKKYYMERRGGISCDNPRDVADVRSQARNNYTIVIISCLRP